MQLREEKKKKEHKTSTIRLQFGKKNTCRRSWGKIEKYNKIFQKTETKMDVLAGNQIRSSLGGAGNNLSSS
jgi:hypothetical protein